jgi:hypothetical protein
MHQCRAHALKTGNTERYSLPDMIRRQSKGSPQPSASALKFAAMVAAADPARLPTPWIRID